jgi:hypothetical protein
MILSLIQVERHMEVSLPLSSVTTIVWSSYVADSHKQENFKAKELYSEQLEPT